MLNWHRVVSAEVVQRDFTSYRRCCSGHLWPAIGHHRNLRELDAFIAEARAAGRRVVVRTRGGTLARETVTLLASAPSILIDITAELDDLGLTDIKALTDSELATALANQNISVVAVGASSCESQKLEPKIFCLPYLGTDFSQIFPKVGLVVHHGK